MLKNYSSTTEFYLLGFPGSKELHNILFATFFFFYLVTVMGNILIIVIVCVDKRLQTPMYFFLGHLSVLEMLTTTVVHHGCLKMEAQPPSSHPLLVQHLHPHSHGQLCQGPTTPIPGPCNR